MQANLAGGVAFDSLLWRCSNESRFSNAAKFAREFFAIQSSSVASELIFSIAENIAHFGISALSDAACIIFVIHGIDRTYS